MTRERLPFGMQGKQQQFNIVKLDRIKDLSNIVIFDRFENGRNMARPRNGNLRRMQILDAVEVCVLEEGLASATLQKVADKADLPRSLVRYHIGNKSKIVELLIDRMMDRADEGLARQVPGNRAANTHDLLDFLFTKGLSDEKANMIIPELWHLAIRDDHIKSRLSKLYGRVVNMLSDQMQADGLGKNRRERDQVAYALMSLAYGDSGFSWLDLKGKGAKAIRDMAGDMVDRLKSSQEEAEN